MRPEDVIGLKIQVMANDPSRRMREYVDIELIMERYSQGLDWRLLEECLSLFAEQEEFQELRVKYCHA